MQVSLGVAYSATVTVDGDLYMWGSNYFGELGDGTSVDKYMPTKIMSNVSTVDLGYNHSAAIVGSRVFSWGNNRYGQCGNNDNNNLNTIYSPKKAFYNYNYISVILGYYCSAAISDDGSLFLCGYNAGCDLSNASLAGGTSYACIPYDINNVISFSFGTSYNYGGRDYKSHCGAVTADGELYMWGLNNYGQLGDGTTISHCSEPKKIMENIAIVSLGDNYSAAVTTDGVQLIA